MSNRIFVPYAIILCALWLNSCSILIVRNENDRREKIAQEHIGWAKEELEKYWGNQLATVIHDDGSKTCVYEFKRLAQVQVGEKFLLTLDALFLGTAEIVIVPTILTENYIQETQAPKTRGFVTYDLENRVKEERCVQID